jgi:tetratricopeptide (TPR) repeat protein
VEDFCRKQKAQSELMNQPHSEFQPLAPSYPLARLPELSPSREVSADYYLKLANQHYTHYLVRALRKELDLAIGHYKQALDMNPSLPEAYVKLASALWDKGDVSLEYAVDYCDKALKLSPNYSDAHLFKGYFLRQSGQLEAAMAQFRLAISTVGAGSPAKAKMALGRTLIQKATASVNHPALARLVTVGTGLREFVAGCCLLPSDRLAFSILRNALMTDLSILGITAFGRSLKIVGLSGQVNTLYTWASRKMPEEALFFHLLGDMHAEKQNPDGALYHYNRALELDPDNVLLHKKLGCAYHQCDDKRNAISSLEKVVQAGEADFETIYSLAHLYTERKDYIRGLYYYKELLKEAPKNPYVHSNMAYALFKMEDYDGAIQEYHYAVNYGEDPLWTSTVAQTLGTLYYQVKQDLEAAEKMFKLAYKKDSGNLESLIMLGDIYTEQGNFEGAIRTYEYLLNVEPDNADCHNYMGYLLWQLDKNEEAVAAYRKAIELDPNNPVAFNNLGVIFLDEHCQLATALEMFEQAVALKPDYTLACFNVARTREALGQTAEAAKGYTEAIRLNAVNPELNDAEIQERIDRLFDVS